MGLFDRLFGKDSTTPTANPAKGVFSNFTQEQLNTLASMLPGAMDLVRSPGNATVVIRGMSEAEGHLVQSLTDTQYKELREIQEIYRSALNAKDDKEKLKLYLRCLARALWHCYATKSVGVCYYMAGDKGRHTSILSEPPIWHQMMRRFEPISSTCSERTSSKVG